ncbi:MAG: DUF4864 domain-containing protein [Geminicoccaceae bacterium]
MIVRVCAIVSLLLFSASNVGAESLTTDDRRAIRTVIEAQLDAFRRDDGAAAFNFASPDIRALFRTPERFMQMVITGYMPVYRPRSVQFRDLVIEQGAPTQKVLLVGPKGQSVVASYQMERQDNGLWLIDGCTLERVEELPI